jgi:hypothetical protein
VSAQAAPILKYVRARDPFECVFALQPVRLIVMHASARFDSIRSPRKEQKRPTILLDVTWK